MTKQQSFPSQQPELREQPKLVKANPPNPIRQVIVEVTFLGQFCLREKGAMRLTLCEAPTCALLMS